MRPRPTTSGGRRLTASSAVAKAASFGALMGARGNSGVITSQILRGIEDGMAGKRRFNGLDLAHALDLGAKTAYKAVTKPVEGTILTVIREAARARTGRAARWCPTTSNPTPSRYVLGVGSPPATSSSSPTTG